MDYCCLKNFCSKTEDLSRTLPNWRPKQDYKQPSLHYNLYISFMQTGKHWKHVSVKNIVVKLCIFQQNNPFQAGNCQQNNKVTCTCVFLLDLFVIYPIVTVIYPALTGSYCSLHYWSKMQQMCGNKLDSAEKFQQLTKLITTVTELHPKDTWKCPFRTQTASNFHITCLRKTFWEGCDETWSLRMTMTQIALSPILHP